MIKYLQIWGDIMDNKSNINWYPGHMAKTKRQIKEMISLIDIVVEVIDSRIPRSSRVPDITHYINDKKRIMVFTKYDLCDKTITDKWIDKYASLGYKVVPVNLKNNSDHKKVIEVINKEMTEINNKRKEKGLLERKAKVLVLGVPNVGKSTLINKITNKKQASVGNKPGVTKSLSWIKINDKIDLLDSPGILWPKIEEDEVALNLASMTSIKEEILPIDTVSFHILKKLSENYTELLEKLYGINDISDVMDTYEKISKYRNIPLINGETDYERIEKLIINDVKLEKIIGVTFDKM